MAAQGGFYSLQDDEDDAGPSRSAGVREDQKKKNETRAIAEPIDLQDRGSKELKKKDSIAPIVTLTNAWVSERAAPELLAWEGECVDAVCSQIEEQVSIIESLASDAATMEEEHVRLALVELDVERARWLLRSYLRSRLDKIERHAAHFALEASNRRNCSQLERGYAIQYAQLNASHFTSAVLDFLPENMRGLDDAAPGGARGDMGGFLIKH